MNRQGAKNAKESRKTREIKARDEGVELNP